MVVAECEGLEFLQETGEKYEIRMSKSETKPKCEIQKAQNGKRQTADEH